MMKLEDEKPQPSFIDIADEDDDFLSKVAAMEADALSNKRRKVIATATGSATPTIPILEKQSETEGIYMAALKGNTATIAMTGVKVVGSGAIDAFQSSVGSAKGDCCFKCGKPGHWARDCVDTVDAGGERGAGYMGSFSNDVNIPEKACPCGLGICTVLTANTEKNRGRKFYKCPVRQENGGCGFFEWCDNPSWAPTNESMGITRNYASKSLEPEILCPCGAGACLILTAKTGKNCGQQFYRCPLIQGSSCGFFKWCNEQFVQGSVSVNADQNYYTTNERNKTSNGFGSGSCFKCGKEGHWARDCTAASSYSSGDSGTRSAPSSNCYKCKRPGHWAKDCINSAHLTDY